jgi:hypothetical protein
VNSSYSEVARCTVTRSDGQTMTVDVNVSLSFGGPALSVTLNAPTATYGLAHSSGGVGGIVATASGGAGGYTYSWSCGDSVYGGGPTPNTSVSSSGNNATVAYNYSAGQSYFWVSVTVNDSGGGSAYAQAVFYFA